MGEERREKRRPLQFPPLRRDEVGEVVDDPRKCAERLRKILDRSQAVQASLVFSLALPLVDFDVVVEQESASIAQLFPEVWHSKWMVEGMGIALGDGRAAALPVLPAGFQHRCLLVSVYQSRSFLARDRGC